MGRRDDGVQWLFPAATDRDFRAMRRVERNADICFAGDNGLNDPVGARHRHIESDVGVSETKFSEVKRDEGIDESLDAVDGYMSALETLELVDLPTHAKDIAH